MTPIFPPSADLRVAEKPRLDPAALAGCHLQNADPSTCSEAALDDHDNAIEAWGEAGWAAVGRTCRWAVSNGAKLPFDCPKPEAEDAR